MLFFGELTVAPLAGSFLGSCWRKGREPEDSREMVVERPWPGPAVGLKAQGWGLHVEIRQTSKPQRHPRSLRPRGPNQRQLKGRSPLLFSRRDAADWLASLLWKWRPCLSPVPALLGSFLPQAPQRPFFLKPDSDVPFAQHLEALRTVNLLARKCSHLRDSA